MHREPVTADFQSGKPWRTLWALYRPQRRDLILGELIYLLKASPVWGLPLVTANIIDVLAKHPADGMTTLAWNAGIGAAMILLNIPSGVLYARFTSRALRGLETSLRSALVRRLQLLSIAYHSRRSSSALQTKVLRDVESIEQMSRQLIDGGTFAVVSILVALVVTAMRMPVFVPVFFLLIPIVVLIRWTLSARMKRYNNEFRHRIESMSSGVLGMITMIPVTRAHAAEDEAIARVESSFDAVSEAGQRLDRHGGLFGAVAWVCFMLLQLGILVAGAMLGYQGKLSLSPGDLVLLSGYVAAIVAAVMQLNSMLPVIARAILRDPRVLILDEATSALDGESEQLVQEALDRLMLGRTTFIVAHRLSTLRRADRVVILKDGRVEDSGTPAELAARFPDRYQSLVPNPAAGTPSPSSARHDQGSGAFTGTQSRLAKIAHNP